MPLIAAAVCPHPPLLVPEVATGAATELDGLRAACDAAVAGLVAARPDRIAVVGADAATVRRPPPHGGSFVPWGLDLTIGSAMVDLPLSLLMGAWLLGRAGHAPAHDASGQARPLVVYQEVSPEATATECAALGASIAGESERVAILAMGDGSACRGVQAPGYADERADPFDAGVADVLASGDPSGLLAIDAGLAAVLLVAGRPAWQVLGGAAAGRSWHARVTYDNAPYGVGYFVAEWS